MQQFDLIVIGSGPAGQRAAIQGAKIGKRVALVEKRDVVGGASINTGTIPSKTLRETSLMLSGWRSRKLFGVDLSLRREATVTDFMRHEKSVTSSERQRVEARLTLRGVTKFHGASKTRSWVHIVGFAGILAVTVFVIMDMEYPRLGMIRVDSFDQVLVDLRQSMK